MVRHGCAFVTGWCARRELYATRGMKCLQSLCSDRRDEMGRWRQLQACHSPMPRVSRHPDDVDHENILGTVHARASR